MSLINFKKFIGFFVAILLLSSCATVYKTVYIEVAQPSEDMLPDDVTSLTLMNRSMTDQFRNYPADSLQHYFYLKDFDVNAVLLDSMAADTILKALGQLLYESGRYQVVIPADRDIPKAKSYYRVDSLLSWDYVNQICHLFNTDALLVIERYINRLKTQYTKYSDVHYATIDSKYDAVVRIYDPRKEKVIQQFVVNDTIYWAEQAIFQRELFEQKLVPIKTALIETGIQVAMDLDDKLSPQWHTESRGYFTIKDDNSVQLESYIKENNWQAAYDYWQNLYAKSTKKAIKSKLEYNLAIASEMQGDILGAAEWAKKSYITQYRIQTDNYFEILKKRIKVIDEFKKLQN